MAKYNTRARARNLTKKRVMVLKLHRIPQHILLQHTRIKCEIVGRVLRPRKLPIGKVLKKQANKKSAVPPIKKEKFEIAKYQMSCQMQHDTLIFAKVRGFRSWPAKILSIEWDSSGTKIKKYTVVFFGTGETASVNLCDMHLYCPETAECLGIISQSRSKFATLFRAAMLEILIAYNGSNN